MEAASKGACGKGHKIKNQNNEQQFVAVRGGLYHRATQACSHSSQECGWLARAAGWHQTALPAATVDQLHQNEWEDLSRVEASFQMHELTPPSILHI